MLVSGKIRCDLRHKACLGPTQKIEMCKSKVLFFFGGGGAWVLITPTPTPTPTHHRPTTHPKGSSKGQYFFAAPLVPSQMPQNSRYTIASSCGWRTSVGGARPWQAAKVRSPEGTQEISRNQGPELSSTTVVPQGDVVADVARGEDKLNLTPGNAAGTATGQR